MKRRQMLKILGLAPPVLFISCERREFSKATIVTGKVIDENGDPIVEVEFSMYGVKGAFLAPNVETFALDGETDKSGQYLFTQHVPKQTDKIYFLLSSTKKIKPLKTHRIYLEKNGVYIELDHSDFDIPRDTWGETTTLNFKYEKI